MQLSHLCIILPADLEEIKPFEDPKIPQPMQDGVRKDRHRGCGSQILHFLGDSLRRLQDSKWIGCFLHDKPSKQQPQPCLFYDLEGIQLSEKVGGANPRIFSYAELYIGSKGFCEDEVLGSGGYGKVYRAVLPSDGTVVAVKCLAERGEQFEKTFAAELVAVAHLRHRNLVRLRGWCVHEEQLLLVYDYMPNRSLDRVLFRRPENLKAAPLSWERRRKIVGGLAAALHYLHEKLETQIIHRDVKTSNVMLDSHYNARLGDFGLARWRAVDLAYPDDRIVLLDWIRGLSGEGKLLQAGDKRLPDGSFGLSDMESLVHLGLLCTLHNPQLRPNMKWVVEALSGNILGKLPPLPSFQSHPRYIAISSASNTSISKTNTTTTTTVPSSDRTISFTSSAYVTAMEETIYETAEFENINKLSSSKSNNRSHRQNALFMVETPREISYKEIISATNNFSDSQRVAEVDFGTASYGILEDGHQVLVKRLGMTQCPAIRVRFSTELLNLGRLRHRNLIQLRGWCTELGEMLVVYDYSASRHMSHLLFHHDNRIGHSILLWRHRYNIIKSLASAVLYLHEEWDEQVIHRNITNSSIILDPDMNPRLGNFALAEFLARNDHAHKADAKENNSVRGIFGYMSPEYIEHGEATPMADVYSYGVVVLEVVSGQMAVDFRRPEVLLVRRVHEFEAQKRPLEDLADIRLNGEYDHEELIRVVKLGIACTRSNPELRPTMRQIVRILDGNDQWFMESGQNTESIEEWRQKNACSLSMIRRVQALGIQ
ncbi:receptor like protein kinase S.2-like [Populus alba x Populus x berolinensis]|nr:receptor like protein kinase S.2-like [Populus alba x Populus x berolinensis]